jgi:hypothetical protein
MKCIWKTCYEFSEKSLCNLPVKLPNFGESNTVFCGKMILRNHMCWKLFWEDFILLILIHASIATYKAMVGGVPLPITLVFVSTCWIYLHAHIWKCIFETIDRLVTREEDMEFPGRSSLLGEQVVQVEGSIVCVINLKIMNCLVSGEGWKSQPILTYKYYMH